MAGGHANGDEPLVAPELARVQPDEVANILKAQSSTEKPAALILDVRDPKVGWAVKRKETATSLLYGQ